MWYKIVLSIIWLGYAGVCISIGDINATQSIKRRKAGITKGINHWVWGFYYAVLCAPMYFVFKDWWFMGSIVLLHILVSPAFNHFVGIDIWNIPADSTDVTDKFLLSLKVKSTEPIVVAAIIISLCLLIMSFNPAL